MLRLAAQNGTHSRPSVNKSHCSPSHTTVSQVALVVKNPPANARDIRDAGWIPGLGRSMEEGMSTHSSVLVWRIPRTEVPGKLQSIGLQRVRHSWTSEYTPTPFCAACSPYFDSSVRSQITSFMALTWDSSWGCELLLSCSYSWVVNIATSQPWDETSHQISATKSWIPDREEKNLIMEAPCLGMLWGTEAAHGETLLEQQQMKQASLQVPVYVVPPRALAFSVT